MGSSGHVSMIDGPICATQNLNQQLKPSFFERRQQPLRDAIHDLQHLTRHNYGMHALPTVILETHVQN